MAEEPTKKVQYCPNCLGPAIREGNEITCEKCDAIFIITKKEGARIKQLGSIEDHEQRLKKLESLIPGEPELEPKEPDEPEEPSILG